jgi:hypothetical protein
LVDSLAFDAGGEAPGQDSPSGPLPLSERYIHSGVDGTRRRPRVAANENGRRPITVHLVIDVTSEWGRS